MTPERCKEILKQYKNRSGMSPDIHPFLTPEEDKEVMDRWRTMNGWTCYFDAFLSFRESR